MLLEVFFDYTCPFCYRGHKNLLELKHDHPALEILWRPCEAHPRPEHASVHSDLAIQGMYFIQEHGGDLWKYHELVYLGMFEDRADIADIDVLAGYAKEAGADPDDFKKALAENQFDKQLLEGNDFAWEEKELEAVPSYIAGEHLIGSRNGVLVSKERLEAFITAYLPE